MGIPHDMGVGAWYRSTPCLVLNGMSWVQGRSTLCLVLMVGLVTWDYVQNELHGFKVIKDCPRSEFVQDRRLSMVEDCSGSETVQDWRLSRVKDYPRSEIVQGR